MYYSSWSYVGHGIDHAWFFCRPAKAFWLLAASSVLIAAAGYIINDYFDLNIDQVNKPASIVVQKIIKRRWAIFWHLGLSVAGMLITLYVSHHIGNWLIALINLVCVLLLWFYSTTFKRQFLIGNLVIALLTAWVVLVLYVSELDVVTLTRNAIYQVTMTRVFKLAMLYGGFAFVISLIREVVKDMEDIAGDEKYRVQDHADRMGHTRLQSIYGGLADRADRSGAYPAGVRHHAGPFCSGPVRHPRGSPAVGHDPPQFVHRHHTRAVS